jgi:hypothetical protein
MANKTRLAADLVFDVNKLDIPSGMRLLAAIGTSSDMPMSSLPEVMEIVGKVVDGGLDGVPLSELGEVTKRAIELIGEAFNPKSTPPVSG